MYLAIWQSSPFLSLIWAIPRLCQSSNGTLHISYVDDPVPLENWCRAMASDLHCFRFIGTGIEQVPELPFFWNRVSSSALPASRWPFRHRLLCTVPSPVEAGLGQRLLTPPLASLHHQVREAFNPPIQSAEEYNQPNQEPAEAKEGEQGSLSAA
jgi:hypothetical protein